MKWQKTKGSLFNPFVHIPTHTYTRQPYFIISTLKIAQRKHCIPCRSIIPLRHALFVNDHGVYSYNWLNWYRRIKPVTISQRLWSWTIDGVFFSLFPVAKGQVGLQASTQHPQWYTTLHIQNPRPACVSQWHCLEIYRPTVKKQSMTSPDKLPFRKQCIMFGEREFFKATQFNGMSQWVTF